MLTPAMSYRPIPTCASVAPSLPASVVAELTQLEERVGQPSGLQGHCLLAEIGEAAALRVLRKIRESRTPVRNLPGFIRFMAGKEAMEMERYSPGFPPDESSACCSGISYGDGSVSGPQNHNEVQIDVQSPYTGTSLCLSNHARVELETASPNGWTSIGFQGNEGSIRETAPVVSKLPWMAEIPSGWISLQSQNDTSPTPRIVSTSNTTDALRERASPQMLALEELEFRKKFMIFAYLSWNKIEDVLSESYIRSLKPLSMVDFESEIWRTFGREYIKASDRAKTLHSDRGTSKVYHCNVAIRGDSVVYHFKGPYMENTRTHLQNVVGDDNVLLVKFMGESSDSKADFSTYCQHYHKIAEDGIVLGLRRY